MALSKNRGVCVGEIHTHTSPTMSEISDWMGRNPEFFTQETILVQEFVDGEGYVPHWETKAYQRR